MKVASALLGLNRVQITRLVELGELPATHSRGGMLLFFTRDLLELRRRLESGELDLKRLLSQRRAALSAKSGVREAASDLPAPSEARAPSPRKRGRGTARAR